MIGSSKRGLGNAANKPNMKLEVLIKHFEVQNRTENKSPRTVEWYNLVLGQLHAWLNREGLSSDVANIDEMIVRQFILHLRERPGTKGATLSSHTMYNKVNALRSFFSWLNQKGYTDGHVLADLKQPRISKQVVDPLRADEIATLLDSLDSNAALGARNHALVSLMLDTGLRLREAAHLTEFGVHLEDRYVKVLGKGDQERIVSFGTACQQAMIHYYFHYRPEPATASDSAFFLTMDGVPLTTDAVKSMIKRLAVSTGIERLHPHLLRHTYATMFLLNGGDVFLLKQNLGTATLTMVQNYLHIASRIAAVRSQTFSPLDSMAVKRTKRYRRSSVKRPGNAPARTGGLRSAVGRATIG